MIASEHVVEESADEGTALSSRSKWEALGDTSQSSVEQDIRQELWEVSLERYEDAIRKSAYPPRSVLPPVMGYSVKGRS